MSRQAKGADTSFRSGVVANWMGTPSPNDTVTTLCVNVSLKIRKTRGFALNEPQLVAIVELDGNSNEDAWAQGAWHAKIEACKAAGITDLGDVDKTPVERINGRGLVVANAAGGRFEARLVTRGSSSVPTNLPLRTLRPGDPDWPFQT